MSQHFQQYSAEFLAAFAFMLGFIVAPFLRSWAIRLSPIEDATHDRSLLRTFGVCHATGMLFGVYVYCFLRLVCQKTPEVRPYEISIYLRMASHLVMFSLLITATLTDLRDHLIPDQITIPGMIIGVSAAFLSGDLQIIHLWVDWNAVIPDLAGPYIPGWIQDHHHWHGLAWSITGLLTGGGLIWAARIISSVVLGQEAMGFGDVTLMAMVGSFVGWQPCVFIFLLAPFCGVLVGITVKLLTNKPYVPYGPFLSAATLVVLFSWRWIWTWEPASWFNLRLMLGDGPSIGILAAVVFGTLAVLLGMLRLYPMIPGKQRDEDAETAAVESESDQT